MTPTEYLANEFRRYFPDATEINATFHDDETIDVDVIFPDYFHSMFSMEIGSDDDYYVFTNIETDLIITVPLMDENDA